MSEQQILDSSSQMAAPPADGRMPVSIVAAAGLAAFGMMAAAQPAFAITPVLTLADVPGKGNIQILNYALALEDLEAELYAQALQRLTTGGTGGGNASSSVGTITGLGLNASQRDVHFTAEFATVENTHAKYLRAKIGGLGGPVIAPFKYDFGIQTMTEHQVISLIFTAEKTGVMAYLGAVPFLDKSSSLTPTVFQIAGSIQGTEARHTAIFAEILRLQFGDQIDVTPLPSPPYSNKPPFTNASPNNKGIDAPEPPNSVLDAVSPFIKTS